MKVKGCELEEITFKKQQVEEKLEDVERLSVKDKEVLQTKLEAIENNLVKVTEVKEQLEIKLNQVSYCFA